MESQGERDGCIALLSAAVRNLSLPAGKQAAAIGMGVVTDELASDFDHAYQVCLRHGYIESQAVRAQLDEVMEALDALPSRSFTAEKALHVDSRWEHLRQLAGDLIRSAEWQAAVETTEA